MPGLSFTANTLSSWLSSSGTLPRGTVTDVCINLEIETTYSKLVFLTATYSAEAPADLPQHLVVKSPLASSPAGDTSEAEFYSQIASSIGSPPLVRCLATIDDRVIVLEDVRATHEPASARFE